MTPSILDRVRRSHSLWFLTVLAAVGAGTFSMTIASGRSFRVAVSAALGALVLLSVVGLAVSGRLPRRVLKTAVHVILGLLMSLVASIGIVLLFAEGALLSSIQTVYLAGLLLVGILLIAAGGLVVSAGARLRLVARVGLLVTVGWGLISVVSVSWIALQSGTIGLEFTEEAAAIWVIFCTFLVLPVLVFRQDLREIRGTP